MKILFVHNNFPGQYRHLAGALARDRNNELFAVGSSTARPFEGVRLLKYDMRNVDVSGSHPFARRFDLECSRAEQVLYALSSLAESGFTPDVILAHPGWGETLPLRAVFPTAHIMLYCEFFYGKEGRDVGFDPEFRRDRRRRRRRTSPEERHDPARPERSATSASRRRPGSARPSRQNTSRKIQPSTRASTSDRFQAQPGGDVFRLPSGRRLSRSRRSRHLRRAKSRTAARLSRLHARAAAILAKRPKRADRHHRRRRHLLRGLPPTGQTWKQRFLDEVADRARHRTNPFCWPAASADYLRALQVSSAHVYLTYPFVLSWSLLEAMSAGCVVIGSDTPPVRGAD